MLKLLGKITFGIVLALLLATLTLPLLIPTEPAQGKAPQELAKEQSHFITIETTNERPIQLHYLRSSSTADSPTLPSVSTAPAPSEQQPALVLLHGFTLNSFSWNELMPLLTKQGEVIAYDQIPYGLSDKPTADSHQDNDFFSLEAAIERLVGLLDELGLERNVLIGNSSGGALALAAAHRHPERIAALVLINPMTTIERMTLPAWLGYSPQIKRLNLLAARWFGASTALLEASYHDPELISGQRRKQALIHTQVAGWDLAWGDIFNRALVEPLDVEQAIAEVEVPTLVVIGAEDGIIAPQESQQLTAKLKNAQQAIIEDCGHLPHEECPQQTYTEIRKWLNAQ